MKNFFRKLFGPSKREVWQQVSKAVNAQYIDDGFFSVPKVVAYHGEWEITLDTHTVSTGKSSTTYTRIRAPYVSKNGFEFRIYREGFFSKIGKVFGMQDIEVGYENFDRDFVIQGNDPYKVELLFENPAIRDLLMNINQIDLRVKDDSGWLENRKTIKPIDSLHFQVIGIIKDVEQLELLFHLFAETLDQLCNIGAAYNEEPLEE
ncbi:MAG: hypothetical protein R3E32_27215 [Chitinophagales bacterium]